MSNHNAKAPPGNKQDVTKLNDRQQAFVDYYIQSNNLSESARRAGYAERSAASTAIELMKNPKIRNAINARLKQLESERIAEDKEILEYLTTVMRGECEDEIVVNVGKGKGFTQAEKIAAKIGAKDRLKAAELLGKIRGMFLNKQEIELTGNIPIVIRDDL